jgi:hypothetical protein
MRERSLEASREIHVVKNTHADDRIELEAIKALTRLDVADDDIGQATDTFATDCGCRLADFETRQRATRLDETRCEFARARTQLKASDSRPETRLHLDKPRTAVRP